MRGVFSREVSAVFFKVFLSLRSGYLKVGADIFLSVTLSGFVNLNC